MKIIFDVHYQNRKSITGVVTFENWDDSKATREFSMEGTNFEKYVSGEFYRRELPCIIKTFKELNILPDIIVIDGYVWLDDFRKGLGAHLFETLEGKVPIIGVAKNYFHTANNSIPIYRGESKKPLYITSEGITTKKASECIKLMHGKFRIPTLIKRADQLSRIY